MLALIALNALAWAGVAMDDVTAVPRHPAPAQPSAPPVESEFTRPASAPQAEPIAQKPLSKPVGKPKTSGTTLILAATRGDCWVEVRAGSATGKALYAGTLASGSSLRFSRPRLWIRLGAASNVDIMVNGHPSTVPPGTVELTVPNA